MGYKVLNIGKLYTIARRDDKKPEYRVINDGVCGFYIFSNIKEAEKACRMINKAKIQGKISFNTEEEDSFFKKHKTNGEMFFTYLLMKAGQYR